MELPQEIQSLFNKYKTHQPSQTDKCDNVPSNYKNSDSVYNPNDLIDVDLIDMSDDQTWLLKTEKVVPNINGWLHENSSCDTVSNDVGKFQKKSIDSRTFTRPKKKVYRPSIEKYNEEFFEDEKRPNILSQEIDNYISKCQKDEINDSFQQKVKPVQFDLSQPVSGSFFDRILATAPELDSFQNMSPPSLVNSMCSSTFTNLMESSYIKNDPVLREIRDADYSVEIFSDATEPPLLQSFSESCSSITTEIAENFVRKTLNNLNGTVQASETADELIKIKNGTEFILEDFTEDLTGDTTLKNDCEAQNIELNGTINLKASFNFNDTYEKDTKLNSTYAKEEEILNSTFSCTTNINENKITNTSGNFNNTLTIKQVAIDKEQNEKSEKISNDSAYKYQKAIVPNFTNINNNLNSTQTIQNRTFDRRSLGKGVKNNFRDKIYDRETSMQNDTFTMDYCDLEDDINSGARRLSEEIDEYLSKTQEIIKENNVVGYSAESSESLDRLSSLSNSSRGSRNMSMAEVDALVEQQEKSLQISTPKPSRSLTKLFDNTCLSPIPNIEVKEHMSDSEVSSEDYCAVRSSASTNYKRSALERNVKSLSNLKAPVDLKQRSINVMTNRLVNKKLTGSSGILNTTQTKSTSSYSNLRMLNSNLKGSYTTLKPFQSNLPNIPPKNTGMAKTDTNIARYMEGTTKTEEFKVPQTSKSAGSSKTNLVKPQSRSSGLPRPVSSATGIPRPSLSKIPAPKSSRLPPARQISRPSSKINVNDGFN